MSHWIVILAISVGLLVVYALVFYLSSLLARGSLFRIKLSYFFESVLPQPKAGPARSKSDAAPAPPAPSNRRKAESARPAPRPEAAAPSPSEPQAPAPPPPKKQGIVMRRMPKPSAAPFTLRDAREAAASQQRVWVKFTNDFNRDDEDKLEIYRATRGGSLFVWFCYERKRGTLRRNRITAWQLLEERFDRSAHLAEWARWQGLKGLPHRMAALLRRQP
ncbi:MAG: hypothetical protein AB1411_08300 [Nitrospirota bacterium]